MVQSMIYMHTSVDTKISKARLYETFSKIHSSSHTILEALMVASESLKSWKDSSTVHISRKLRRLKLGDTKDIEKCINTPL